MNNPEDATEQKLWKRQTSWDLASNSLTNTWQCECDGQLALKEVSPLIIPAAPLAIPQNLNNYILLGENHEEQLCSGIYAPEIGLDNICRAWTSGKFSGFLKTVGDEGVLHLELISGLKASPEDLYNVKVILQDIVTNEHYFEQAIDCLQTSVNICNLEFCPTVEPKILRLIINSDTFCPRHLNMSEDGRLLGIQLHTARLYKSIDDIPQAAEEPSSLEEPSITESPDETPA